jgi:hypothetical protein
MHDGFFIPRPKYTLDVNENFHVSDCKLSPKPFKLVSSYLLIVKTSN